tara:strand:- start:973 stop:1626 length:654 start_codon:yes stop_codon:yes gene_type:complete
MAINPDDIISHLPGLNGNNNSVDLRGRIGHLVWEHNWRDEYNTINSKTKSIPVFSFKIINKFQYFRNNIFHGYDNYGWNNGCPDSGYSSGKAYIQYHYFGNKPSTLEIKERSGRYFLGIGYYNFNQKSLGFTNKTRKPNRINIQSNNLLLQMRSQQAPGGAPINGSLVYTDYNLLSLLRLSLDNDGILYKEGLGEAYKINFNLLKNNLSKYGLFINN